MAKLVYTELPTNDRIAQLVALTRKRPLPIGEVARKLNLERSEVSALTLRAHKRGYAVVEHGGHISSRPVSAHGLASGHVEKTLAKPKGPGRYRVAQATDIHFGSMHCDRDALLSFLHRAHGLGVRTTVITGDILDGHSPKLLFEQRAIGLDAQINEALATFRRGPKGMRYVCIDGNHDGYHSSLVGIDCGRLVEARARESGLDWHHLGPCLGQVKIYGAVWQLWHPHGSGATRNAVRRVLNARAEHEAGRREALDVLAIGHFHKHVSFTAYPEGTFCVSGGTFQRKGSEFANRISGPWDVGGTIVSYTVDTKGRASEFAAEFYPA